MEEVDLNAYLANPVGRWTAGEGWFHYCAASPLLAGATIWGTLGASSCEALLRCITAVPERHAALLDGRRVSSLDGASFALALEYMVRHRDVLGTRIVRLAGVRPLGALGGALREALHISMTPYPATLFAERNESLCWLECEKHAAAIDAIEHRVLAFKREPTTRQRLAQIVEERPQISREAAAKRLGMSLRTFQRRLREDNSTFQAELAVGRVRLAKRLMTESDAPLARIALAVGFNTPAVFSTVFRKVTGKRPSEWRYVARNEKLSS